MSSRTDKKVKISKDGDLTNQTKIKTTNTNPTGVNSSPEMLRKLKRMSSLYTMAKGERFGTARKKEYRVDECFYNAEPESACANGQIWLDCHMSGPDFFLELFDDGDETATPGLKTLADDASAGAAIN